MKIILLDPGLKHSQGHNYATDLHIAKYFKKNNFNVEVLCLKTIDRETEEKFLKNKIKLKKKFLIFHLTVTFHTKMTIHLLNLFKLL